MLQSSTSKAQSLFWRGEVISPSLTAAAIFLVLFMISDVSRSFEQAVFGSIVGTVTDPTGAVLPNATVVVTDISKGTMQTVQSNGSGNYTASRLIPDTYSVKATVQGFKPTQVDNVTAKAAGLEYRHALEQALRFRRPSAVLLDEAQHLA